MNLAMLPELWGVDPSCESGDLVIFRSMNELEGRHLGRIPFVHDLSADYTPSDIAVDVG